MSIRREPGCYDLPDTIVRLMVQTAEHFGGVEVADLWCYDPRLLRESRFASRRVGYVVQESRFRELVDEEPQLELVHRDPFQTEPIETYDVVYWGPPWGVPVEWKQRRHRVEAFMLDRAIASLAEGGVAVCLATPNVLYARLWRDVRQRILHEFSLELTVEISRGSLWGTAIQPVMVIIRNTKQRGSVFLSRYTSEPSELLSDFENGTGSFHVPASQIVDRWDRNYHDPRYSVIDETLAEFPVQTIGDLAMVLNGRNMRAFHSDDGQFAVVSGGMISRGGFSSAEDVQYADVPEDDAFQRCILRGGDIVVSSVKPRIYVYRDSDPPAVAGPSVIVIRPNSGSPYLTEYLSTNDGRWLFDTQVERKATALGNIPRISAGQLRAFQIPIVPLSSPQLLSSDSPPTESRRELEQLGRELMAARRQILRLRHQLEQEEARHASAVDRTAAAELQLRKVTVTQQFIEAHFAQVNERLSRLQSSVDELHDVLKEMASEFSTVKASSRNTEERLVRMRAMLERYASCLVEDTDTYQIYVEIVATWLDDWSLLNEASQRFLASAEQLYDVFSGDSGSDFSPFVLQYCRAVECELLRKVFEPYHDDFNSRHADRAAAVQVDLTLDKVARFAKAIKSDNRKHPMGTMLWVLNLARPDGTTSGASPLIQDFTGFVQTRFGTGLLSQTMTDRLAMMTQDFRNKAAHPAIMSQQMAHECRTLVREVLVEFLRCCQTSQ